MSIHARFEFNENKTKLTVKYGKDSDPLYASCEDFFEAFETLGLSEPPSKESIEKVFEECENTIEAGVEAELIIAESQEPIEGLNGYLDFQVNVTGEAEFSQAEEDEATDFKNQTAYTEVVKDEIIAKVVAPKMSQSGLDLFGQELKVKPVFQYQFQMLEGVRLEGEDIFADIGGIPHFKKRQIYVKNCVCVEGDVGPVTGNIQRSGCVHVTGDILEGYEVETDEDLFVNGGVYKSQVKVGGNISIGQGMIQDDFHTTICEGDLTINYIQGGHLIVKGDLTVQKDILHAEVECLGNIVVGGDIIGGYVKALKSIEVGSSGNIEGTRTRLKVLHHFEYDQLCKIRNQLMESSRQIQQQSHDEKEVSEDSVDPLEELNLQIEAIRQKLLNLDTLVESVYFPHIKWNKGYYSGTFVKIRHLRTTFTSDNLIPIVASIDKDSGLISTKTQ